MTRNSRARYALLLGLLAVLSLGACGDDKTTIIQGGSGELAGVTATPDEIAFEHTAGRTACVQLAGSFRVLNTTTAMATVTFRVEGDAPLRLPTGVPLPAGGAQEIPVIFDCSLVRVVAPFVATVTVLVDGQVADRVTVRGNVHF